MNDPTNQKKKKSIYKEYWQGPSSKNAVNSVDSNGERMCMACKSGCGQKQKAVERLDE